MSFKRKVQPPLAVNPSSVIFYGLPKTGKTYSLVQLEDHVVLDFANETDFVSCNRQKIGSLKEFRQYITEAYKAKQNGESYRYIILDNSTEMENIFAEYALEEFKKHGTSLKEEDKANLTSIFDLAMGGGEKWYRDAWKYWLKILESLCETVIIIGHVKDKELSTVATKEEVVDERDLQLRGQLAIIMASYVSAMGFVYRDLSDNLVVTFKSNKTSTGSRCIHLANKEFVIMAADSSTANWSEVFVDTSSQKIDIVK